MDNHSTYYVERENFLSLWSTSATFMVTLGDNGASKKSNGNGPKIHLCGAKPNKLKHGGFVHRPPLGSIWFFFVWLHWSCKARYAVLFQIKMFPSRSADKAHIGPTAT